MALRVMRGLQILPLSRPSFAFARTFNPGLSAATLHTTAPRWIRSPEREAKLEEQTRLKIIRKLELREVSPESPEGQAQLQEMLAKFRKGREELAARQAEKEQQRALQRRQLKAERRAAKEGQFPGGSRRESGFDRRWEGIKAEDPVAGRSATENFESWAESVRRLHRKK